jgi:hypothetical protein
LIGRKPVPPNCFLIILGDAVAISVPPPKLELRVGITLLCRRPEPRDLVLNLLKRGSLPGPRGEVGVDEETDDANDRQQEKAEGGADEDTEEGAHGRCSL